ncbi:MAG: hypothetical protein ACI8RD_008536 [Bacillariaceae sp.]|jgi:hypothetical protein
MGTVMFLVGLYYRVETQRNCCRQKENGYKYDTDFQVQELKKTVGF